MQASFKQVARGEPTTSVKQSFQSGFKMGWPHLNSLNYISQPCYYVASSPKIYMTMISCGPGKMTITAGLYTHTSNIFTPHAHAQQGVMGLLLDWII